MSGATIYYTTNGSEPTQASAVYTGPITISSTSTLKAKAYKEDLALSNLAQASYVILEPVGTPTSSLSPGTYTSSQSLSLSTATSGATIYYSTDGSTPTTSSAVYSSALTIASTTTLKAFAKKSGMADSAIFSGIYTITGTVDTPSFSVAAGTYDSLQTITLSSTTVGSTIYYTTDGSDPTASSSVYFAPINVSSTTTLKALATKNLWVDSAIASATYNFAVATPTFSLAAGTYSTAQNVSISTTTAGATIYYTLDGTTPTSSSLVYSSALALYNSTTIKTIGIKSGLGDSSVATRTYMIQAVPGPVCLDNRVSSIVTSNDGMTYLGGEFTKIGTCSGSAIPIDASSGNPSIGLSVLYPNKLGLRIFC